MLANINSRGVGGERPLDFSSAYRISSRTLAPAAILTASLRLFSTATEEKTQGSLFLEEKNISRVPRHFITTGDY